MQFLIIQTAFIGDVVLATAIIEKLRKYYPEAEIDFLVRKGNEGVLSGHPYIRRLLIWDKKASKYRNLISILAQIRRTKYTYVITLQRYFSSGILTGLSGADHRIGFTQNPLSFLFTHKAPHRILKGIHETDRNQSLIASITDNEAVLPVLYPGESTYIQMTAYKDVPYVCIAPSSVWYTKQFPRDRWLELIERIPYEIVIYLLGGASDYTLCESMRSEAIHPQVVNMAGKLNLLQSAALMRDAQMNYVNDSGPLHLASAVNAPTCAVFCSTTPDFGFGPLAEHSVVVEVPYDLECRPCHLHGRKQCPHGHFRCAKDISLGDIPLPR